MSTPNSSESLVSQIKGIYADKPLVGMPGPAVGTLQDIDVKLGLKSPHFSEIKDIDKYEAEEKEWSPIQYFKHKETEKRIMRIASPFENRSDIIVELPEKPKDKYLQQLITEWKDIQHIVMIDQEMLELVYEMGVRYVTRNPMIIEGPPARSKTFAAWVFSTMLETPYARMTCSASTRENYFMGSLMPSNERIGLYTIKEVLTNPTVLDRIKRCEEALKNKEKLSWQEQDEIAMFLTSIKTLIRLEDPSSWLKKPVTKEDEEAYELFLKEGAHGKAKLDDNRVILAYDIIANQTGMSLTGETRYAYKDSDYIRLYEGSGMVVVDELNTIQDDGVQAVLLPTLEPRTPSIIVSPQRNPPNTDRHNDFWPVITMNPANTAGRRILADPTISRNLGVKLGPVTDEYVESIVNFYLTGNDPEIRMGGKLYRGRKDVKTPYRALENIPYRELVAKAITYVHTTMTDWIDNQKIIGQARREGGFYVFDQRKVTAVLDVMLEYYNKRFIETSLKLGTRAESEIDWSGALKSALEEVYEAGINGEVLDPKSDRYKVHGLIEGLPIWDKLQQASGKKASPLKEVTTARGKGLRPS